MLKILLIWIVAIALSTVSVTAALGAIAKNKAPELALSLFPKNGFAAEVTATRLTRAFLIENQGNFPYRAAPSWTALAVQAFKSEPVSADAIAVIALSHTGEVRRDMMYKAFELSRRQQLVTGWMIADSGRQDNIPNILIHYDTILRTSSSAEPIVIPIMAKALANDSFIEPIASFLEKRPPWAASFWRQVVSTPEAIDNAAKLRRMLFRANEGNNPYRDVDLIRALVRDFKFEPAEELYEILSPSNKEESLVRNSDFLKPSKYPPIDWQLISNGEFGASIDGGTLNMSAIPNSGGMFARQIVKLPSRVLVLSITMDQNIPKNASVYLELSCADDIKQKPKPVKILLRENSVTKKISNEDSVCQSYWLSIFGRSSTTGDGFDISIDSISLSLN